MADVLVVEDEALLGRSVTRALQKAGHRVRLEATGDGGVRACQKALPDLVLLDLRLPDATGLDVLKQLRALDSQLVVVMMTAYGSIEDAVEAMRRGAADYLQKPLDLRELRLLVDRLTASQRRDRELEYLRERDAAGPGGVVGDDPRLGQILDHARRLARAQLPPARRPAILLTGETGTGKGVVARAIHEILGGGPFIEVNCTALPASLIEGELFGHERGTFTDAKDARAGLFEAAAGGGLFLDEIGHLDPAIQTKFLKVVEEKRVRRLGSTRDRAVDVYVIAATNRDLGVAVEEGAFREDLLHRLSVLSFEVPPLRERPEDIRLLARHFARELGDQYGKVACALTPDAEAILTAYPWPGNVRELRNVIERATLIAEKSELGADSFQELVDPVASTRARGEVFKRPDTRRFDLEGQERRLIEQALAEARDNQTRAAEWLGISRHALRYRMEKFGLL